MSDTNEQIKKIRESTIEILKTYFMDEADEELKKINELLKSPTVLKNRAQVEELEVYACLLKFILFQTLSEREQLGLFEKSLVKAFKVGIDIRNRFSIKMNLTSDVLWPETLQLFIEAMLRNEERIGLFDIRINGEKQDSPPYLLNWLRDYNRIYGMDRHEKIIPVKYITENPNVAKLSKEEKFLLLQIIEFYEELKFPSQKQIRDALQSVLEEYSEELTSLESPENNNDNNIISDVREKINPFSQNLLSGEIIDLIKKYPRIGEQKIGQNPIKLLYNGEIVNPTIENWLQDYRAYAGSGTHEINERSDYLLRSPNVQNLTSGDRDHLGLILRSYDEGYLLSFSKESQEIIF